jgi:biopolymer transport protein ExbB
MLRRRSLCRALTLVLPLAALFALPVRARQPAPESEPAGPPAAQAQPSETPATPSADQPAQEEEVEEVVGSVSLFERLGQGGKTMIFLLALSIMAVSCAVERAFRLRRKSVVPPGLAREAMALWSENRFDEMQELCERRPSTLATVINAFVRHQHCSTLELSTLAGDLAGRDMRRHLQKAYPIAVAATLAPLLGLLGTVIGMIESFEVVAIAGSLGDASLLAGGISKALVTTATGLVIAVPALALYHLLKSRTNGLAMALEGEVHELLTTWFMDADEDEGDEVEEDEEDESGAD